MEDSQLPSSMSKGGKGKTSRVLERSSLRGGREPMNFMTYLQGNDDRKVTLKNLQAIYDKKRSFEVLHI